MSVLKGAWETNPKSSSRKDWESLTVAQFQKEKIVPKKFPIIWLTGQPGSGKTLSNAINRLNLK